MAQRGNVFQSIPVGRIGRTNFNLSHQLTGNFKEGICYPVFCEETIPGDSWRINTFNISKLETLIAPAMQRTNASLLWFKIPKRLCMKNFRKWYSGGKDGNTDVEKPYFMLSSFVDYIMNSSRFISSTEVKMFTDFFFGPGTVWQMVGLPIPYVPDNNSGTVTFVPPVTFNGQTKVVNWNSGLLSQKIDLIPFIAYAKLYDEYFMDQTLSESVFIQDEDFPNFNSSWRKSVQINTSSYISLSGSSVNVFDGGEFDFEDIVPLFCSFRRAWQKDYYTSAMPTPQRGPEVSIDMFQNAKVPVGGDDVDFMIKARNTADQSLVDPDETLFTSERIDGQNDVTPLYLRGDDGVATDYHFETGLKIPKDGGLTADLSGLSPISIVAFRNLFKLQAFLEKNNIAGGRFIEFILAHWAERVPDFTVQRPVFVRATQIPVIVSEVTATANSEGINSVVGDQAGRAKGQGNLGRCRIYTQEPSVIIGIYCVTPPPSYVTQGIPKKFQRMTRWDEPYNEFQHIGEQAILNKEIFVPFSVQYPSTILEREFGYQQRYSEFKYLPDRVVGEFATSLSYWHQARMFSAPPALNQTFIENNPSDRIFAVQNQNPVIADFWFDINCSRKLSKFSTPKLN